MLSIINWVGRIKNTFAGRLTKKVYINMAVTGLVLMTLIPVMSAKSATENKESNITDNKETEALTEVADKVVEDEPTENKPVENKPVENRPVENKPVENKPVEEAMTEAVTEAVAETATEPETEKIYLSEAEVKVTTVVTTTYAAADIYYTENDYDALLRIVEAEAGNQDDVGKILVANVIINRVKNQRFPNDIYSVITQKNGNVVQFSPTRNGGSFYTITPSEHTKQCVDRALAGEDYSQGALYFCCKTGSDSWFNTKLQFLFTHGPHYFYKYK